MEASPVLLLINGNELEFELVEELWLDDPDCLRVVQHLSATLDNEPRHLRIRG